MTAQLAELNKALLNDFQHFVDQLENKDLYTQGHSHHVMVVVQALYNRLPVDMTEGIDLYDLSAAALLHDIGKIEVSDKTLNKEGALDETEWEEMRQHPMLSF